MNAFLVTLMILASTATEAASLSRTADRFHMNFERSAHKITTKRFTAHYRPMRQIVVKIPGDQVPSVALSGVVDQDRCQARGQNGLVTIEFFCLLPRDQLLANYLSHITPEIGSVFEVTIIDNECIQRHPQPRDPRERAGRRVERRDHPILPFPTPNPHRRCASQAQKAVFDEAVWSTFPVENIDELTDRSESLGWEIKWVNPIGEYDQNGRIPTRKLSVKLSPVPNSAVPQTPNSFTLGSQLRHLSLEDFIPEGRTIRRNCYPCQAVISVGN